MGAGRVAAMWAASARVDLVGGSGSGSGYGTPCGGSGGQLERITERDQDRRVVSLEETPAPPGREPRAPCSAGGYGESGRPTIVPWQATGTTGAPDRTAR